MQGFAFHPIHIQEFCAWIEVFFLLLLCEIRSLFVDSLLYNFCLFFVFLWINSSLSKLTNFDNLCNEMNTIHIVIFSFLFCISLNFSFLRDFLFLLNFSFLRDVSFFLDFSLSPSFFYLTASPPFFVWKMLQFRTIFWNFLLNFNFNFNLSNFFQFNDIFFRMKCEYKL